MAFIKFWLRCLRRGFRPAIDLADLLLVLVPAFFAGVAYMFGYEIIVDVPWWLLVLAVLGLVLIVRVVVVAPYEMWREGRTANTSSPTRSEWEQELHDLSADRRDIWQLLHGAYVRSLGDHTNRSEAPLLNLIQNAEYPDLPPADGREFSKWAWDAPDEWSESAQKLNNFAAGLYPATTPPVAVQSPYMSYSDHRRFDSLRMELAKFWDKWGRQELLEAVIKEQNMDSALKSHTVEIKMLTFLEIARARWMPAGAVGKGGLFRLGQRNAEMES